MDKFIISASILSCDFGHLADQIHQCQESGVDWIHIDVMDGVFVPNITMGPFIVETCQRLTNMPLDVHLMIEKPERHIENFAKAGANFLTVHFEDAPNIYRTLQSIKGFGINAGIAINPGTPASQIEAVASLVDLVLVMTVNPGFSGQEFIPAAAEKVKQVRKILDRASSNAVIQVDGGISSSNLAKVYQAGARSFVAATAIFKSPLGIAGGVKALRESIS